MNFKQKKVTVNDVEYTLQKMPIRPALAMRQKWQKNGNIDDIIMCDEVFKNIVVEPKVKLDDFEFVEDAEELASECISFQYLGKSEQEK